MSRSQERGPFRRASKRSLTAQLYLAWRRLQALQVDMHWDARDAEFVGIVSELKIAMLAFEQTSARSNVNCALIEIAAADLRLRMIEATLDLLGPYACVQPAAPFELSAVVAPTAGWVVNDYLNALAAMIHCAPARARLATQVLNL